MERGCLSGRNYVVDLNGNGIYLYKVHGMVLNGRWVTDQLFETQHGKMYATAYCEVTPVAVSLCQLLAVGRQHGNEVASVVVSNRVAIHMFLEGTLTADNFAVAYEVDERIMLPDVSLGDGVRIPLLVIASELVLSYEMATYDSAGQQLSVQ